MRLSTLLSFQRIREKSSLPETSLSACPATNLLYLLRADCFISSREAKESFRPGWQAPVRRTQSELRLIVFTQWAWPVRSCSTAPSSGFHTLTVLSSEEEQIWLLPDQSTLVMQLRWTANTLWQVPLRGSQILRVLSLLAEMSLLPPSCRCTGSQARAVTHLVWPFSKAALLPLERLNTQTSPSMPPEAKRSLQGEKATQSTQFLWPLQTVRGVSVYRSQRRTVVSPEAEATFLLSGENCTDRMLSLCPCRDDDHLVTGAMQNRAQG